MGVRITPMSVAMLHVLDSPYGPLALTADELRAGLERARAVVPESNAPDEASRAQRAELLDADAAARLLGVRPSWLLKRARERRIPHVRVGKFVRFDPDDVRAALGRHADSQYADPNNSLIRNREYKR